MRRPRSDFGSGGATIEQLLFGLANQRNEAGAARSAEQFDARTALVTAVDFRREAEACNDYFRVALEAARSPTRARPRSRRGWRGFATGA